MVKRKKIIINKIFKQKNLETGTTLRKKTS